MFGKPTVTATKQGKFNLELLHDKGFLDLFAANEKCEQRHEVIKIGCRKSFRILFFIADHGMNGGELLLV